MTEQQVAPELTEDTDPATAVAVAYCHRDNVDYAWHHSMVEMLGHDLAHHGRVWRGGYVAVRTGTDGLADARNSAVTDFLESDAGWLFWIDTDQGFPPTVIDDLVAVADPEQRPVVGALVFANREVLPDGLGGWRCLLAPTVFDWAHDGDETGFAVRWDYPQDTVTRVSGTGSACILVHRSVFERVRDRYGPVWYDRARNPSTGKLIGEDLSFCVRLMALGIPIHVHTGVPTSHVKRSWLTAEDYWIQRAVNKAPVAPDSPLVPPPARSWSVPRFAVIPTHNRPARLLSLVVSLGTQVDHIVVLDNASDPPVDGEKLLASVPERCTVHVIPDGEQPPHLSRYWNVMLDACAGIARGADADTWDVAVLNDDATVPAGWVDSVAVAMRTHPTAVVAFTDLYGKRSEPTLMTQIDNDPATRMCPHAFVTRGEAGLRADEDMRWWFFDTDFDLSARQAGGVLAVPGPRVGNALANSTTRGPLAEQAMRDQAAFRAKWGEL